MRTLLCVAILCLSHLTFAQDHADNLANYLTDDVVAVAYLDLTSIDTMALLEWADELGFGPGAEHRAQANDLMLKIQQQLDRTADLGASSMYVLFRASDLAYQGPTWVVPVAAGKDPKAILGMLLSGRPDKFHVEHELRPPVFPEHCEVQDGVVIGANSPEQLAMLRTTRPSSARDLSAAWEALGQGSAGLIIFGDENSRKVVREMVPRLPAPLQAIDGPLVADRLLWGGVTMKLPPQPDLKLLIETTDSQTALALQDSFRAGLQLVRALPEAQQILTDEGVKTLVEGTRVTAADQQLVISFADLLGNIQAITQLLSPPVRQAREAAWRSQRMNNFKQIALAMHNYHSVHKTFPARGSYDPSGRPLLSWRVHLLPYLEHEELYKQFHLDEPWDSDHNKTLLEQMPRVYWDPDPALHGRNQQGRTTYVVPTGDGTLFSGMKGRSYKEVTDGTSQTIMLTEVSEPNAVPWTQPLDWNVDLSNPWRDLRRQDRSWITFGIADGSVRIIESDMSAENLRALLTIEAGDVVEWP